MWLGSLDGKLFALLSSLVHITASPFQSCRAKLHGPPYASSTISCPICHILPHSITESFTCTILYESASSLLRVVLRHFGSVQKKKYFFQVSISLSTLSTWTELLPTNPPTHQHLFHPLPITHRPPPIAPLFAPPRPFLESGKASSVLLGHVILKAIQLEVWPLELSRSFGELASAARQR